MTRLGIGALIALAACEAGPVEPEAWQLDQDRAIAVRLTPPRLLPGEHATIEVLVAHAGGTTTEEAPSIVTAGASPLAASVNFLFDHWEVIAPDADTLAAARGKLGIAEGAPIPLELEVFIGPLSGAHLSTQKRVWLDATATNPALPPIVIDGAAVVPGTALALPLDREVTLVAAASEVRWLTSCGTLRDSAEPDALLLVAAACTGELVVVVRDGLGGVVWQVWPIATR